MSEELTNVERVVVDATMRWFEADNNEHWADARDRDYAIANLKQATTELRRAAQALKDMRRLATTTPTGAHDE